jgi:hypothetical protein
MDGGAAAERDGLPVQGFRGTPDEIERQWYEQVYRGRGDSMRQLTWRAVVIRSLLGGVLSLTNLYVRRPAWAPRGRFFRRSSPSRWRRAGSPARA